MQLHEKLLVFDEDRKVIVAGSLNPKLVGGRPGDSMLYYISFPAIDLFVNIFFPQKCHFFLNAILGSHFYFHNDFYTNNV